MKMVGVGEAGLASLPGLPGDTETPARPALECKQGSGSTCGGPLPFL